MFSLALPLLLTTDRIGTRGISAGVVLLRATTDIILLTALAVYVGRTGTPFAVSMVMAAYFLGLMLFSPFWGALADVTGRRQTILVLTTLLATVAVIPLIFLQEEWSLIGAFFLYTVFAAGYQPLVLAMISERATDGERGGSVGIINSARAAGGTSGRVLAGLLVGLLAPALLYLLVAGISLLGSVSAVFISDSSQDQAHTPALGNLLATVKSRAIPDVHGDLLRTGGLRWLYLGIAVQGVSVGGVLSLMPVYLIRDVGVSEGTMGLLLGISPALQTLLMYPFGRIADRIGRKLTIVVGTFGRSVLFPLLAAGITLATTLNIRMLLGVLSFTVLAISFSAMLSGAVAFIGDITPSDRTTESMGLLWTALSVGGVLGPLLLGTIATLTTYELSYIVGAVLSIGATALLAVGISDVQ